MSTQEFSATVHAIAPATPTILVLFLRPHEPFSFLAGQHVEVSFPSPNSDTQSPFWPFSIASPPEWDEFQLCIRRDDTRATTEYLDTLQPGAQVRLRGPFGKFVYQSSPGRHIGMLATGTGLAPLRSMLQSAPFQRGEPASVKLLLGVQTLEEIPFYEELKRIPHLQWIPVLSKAPEDWAGQRGWITEYLESQNDLFLWAETDFYLCGQSAMMQRATQYLIHKGVAPTAIFTSY